MYTLRAECQLHFGQTSVSSARMKTFVSTGERMAARGIFSRRNGGAAQPAHVKTACTADILRFFTAAIGQQSGENLSSINELLAETIHEGTKIYSRNAACL